MIQHLSLQQQPPSAQGLSRGPAPPLVGVVTGQCGTDPSLRLAYKYTYPWAEVCLPVKKLCLVIPKAQEGLCHAS